MDDAHSAKCSPSHENLNGSLSGRSPFNVEPGANRYPLSLNVNNENRAPPPLPTALNSMLKNNTERGDIGQFDIKPSHIPNRLNSPRQPAGTYSDYPSQRPQQNSRPPHTAPIVDDRRWLPSHTKDAASEIVSMCERASQKSSESPQLFDETDYRSYSMTQTLHSAYPLSNHRSYASLRGQPEPNLVPRPRSPFPYPARLKRLGFRPSSPVLTDGGRVDHSRRAEIERTPIGSSFNTSSSSPFYAYKRVPPPLTVRSDANRSNPSLRGNSSFARLSNLSTRCSTNDSPQDPIHHPNQALGKASPARSTLSLASTSSLYYSGPSGSTTTTPSKLHTPSPLYYDYTENFNVDEAYHGDAISRERLPPIPFLIDRTIHEDRELSSESSSSDTSIVQGSPTTLYLPNLVRESNGDIVVSPVDKSRLNTEDDQNTTSTSVSQDILPFYFERRSYDEAGAITFDDKDFPIIYNSKCATNPTLQSKDDIKPSLSPEPVDSMSQNNPGPQKDSLQLENHERWNQDAAAELDSVSNRTSSFRLSAYLPNFPKPPNRPVRLSKEGVPTTPNQRGQVIQPGEPTPAEASRVSTIVAVNEALRLALQPPSFNPLSMPASSQDQQDGPGSIPQRPVSAHDNRIRSTHFLPLDHSLTDVVQLITRFEDTNRSFALEDMYPQPIEVSAQFSMGPLLALAPTMTLIDSPTLPTESLSYSFTPPGSRTSLNKFRSEGDLRSPNLRPSRNVYLPLSEERVALSNDQRHRGDEIQYCASLSHHIPRKSPSRSEPPMFAPQPISPARILKLKHSIPQLMKVLPPVPREPISEISSPQRPPISEVPSRFSPLLLQPEPESAPVLVPQLARPKSAVTEPMLAQRTKYHAAESIPTPHPPKPPKLRLKTRSAAALRSLSPPSPRPWTLDESYPWSSRRPAVRLSSIQSNAFGTQKQPKFNMRVIRASSSSFGTKRINKEARGQNVVSTLELEHPKDLFTSTPGLSEMFRQVGRHFSLKNAGATVESIPAESLQPQFTASASSKLTGSHGEGPGTGTSSLSPTAAYPISPSEVRSFFSDDSSLRQRHNSLRNRISNLRARIPNPYTSRQTGQSYEDVDWKEQSAGSAPPIGGSRFNHTSRQEDEYGIPVTDFRRHGLKSKVSGWFKGARMAVGRFIKTRNSDVE